MSSNFLHPQEFGLGLLFYSTSVLGIRAWADLACASIATCCQS